MLEVVVGSYEKDLLEETSLFEKENIVDVSLLLSIGNIKNLKKMNIRNVASYSIDVKEKIEELKQKISKSSSIRIWYSNLSNEEVCALYFIINLINDVKNTNIYVCNVASDKYFSLGNYSVSEIKNLLDKTRIMSQEEINLYVNSWNCLEEENGDLRIVRNNKLYSESFEYLHNDILCLLKKYNYISYYEFVGECYKSRLCGFDIDVVFIKAIDDLINSGKIQDCKIEQSENIKVTPDKRYIKVSDNYI